MKTESINYGHKISHRRTESFLVHGHLQYELYYYLRGNISVLVKGQEYQVEPNTLLVFPPNVFHGIRVNDEDAYERFTLEFSPSCIQPERRDMLLQALPTAEAKGDAICMRTVMEDTAMHALLLQMDKLCGCDRKVQDQMVPVVLEAILGTIALSVNRQQDEGQEPVKRKSDVSNILTYVNEHFTEPITLDSLTELFFVSKDHLNRSFRKVTGTTVRDYLISKRVTYVQQLLINGIPAAQAAILAGFGDYTSFYRAYVKRTGHAPSRDRIPKSPAVPTDKVLQEQMTAMPDNYSILVELD